MIAPILKSLSKTNIREIYLPKDIWYDYFTKEKIASNGMWIRRKIDLQTLPIYVKERTTLNYCAMKDHLQNGIDNIIKTEIW